MTITNPDEGIGLLAAGLPLFEFSAYPYALEDLDGGPKKTQRHAIDLKPRDFVTLNVDAAQMGVGGDTSWGALPHFKYRLQGRALGYAWALRPFKTAETDIDRLVRDIRTDAAYWQEGKPPLPFEMRNLELHMALGKQATARPRQVLPWSRAGDAGLVDGIIGSVDYRDGEWCMVEDADFQATIDMGQPRPVKRVSLAFLLRPASSLLLPTRVRVQASSDGAAFRDVAAVDVPAKVVDVTGVLRLPVRISLPGEATRFVRVVAANPGPCPAGLPCAGAPARLAVDEIIVR